MSSSQRRPRVDRMEQDVTPSRAATVSTYIVGFLPFVAEYFCRHAFRLMLTGLRRGFFGAPTFRKSY